MIATVRNASLADMGAMVDASPVDPRFDKFTWVKKVRFHRIGTSSLWVVMQKAGKAAHAMKLCPQSKRRQPWWNSVRPAPLIYPRWNQSIAGRSVRRLAIGSGRTSRVRHRYRRACENWSIRLLNWKATRPQHSRRRARTTPPGNGRSTGGDFGGCPERWKEFAAEHAE